jgi:hypothetical protein
MGESVTQRDMGHDYTATVTDAGDLSSPVVVTSGKYVVRFDGNDFATKHLRRIRRNSVSELTRGNVAGKLNEYVDESTAKAVTRFGGNDQATSTFIFLDLGQYCQFGCQVIKFLASDRGAWQVYPPNGANQCLQKHTQITLGQCFASSNSGFGQVREHVGNPDRLQHGIGITLTVTVKQPLNGNGLNVQVCHYAGGQVAHEFSPETMNVSKSKLTSIGKSIVST